MTPQWILDIRAVIEKGSSLHHHNNTLINIEYLGSIIANQAKLEAALLIALEALHCRAARLCHNKRVECGECDPCEALNKIQSLGEK